MHRPFLIAAVSSPSSPSGTQPYNVHVTACVAASIRTIKCLYEMYKHRPYFRTWWYNTTYTLYASMILLYVILSNIDTESSNPEHTRDRLVGTVQQSLEIFQSMDMVTVARRCAEVTQEVLDIAKKPPQQAAPQSSSTRGNMEAPVVAASGMRVNLDHFHFEEFGDDSTGGLDFLVGPNLMDGFAPFPTTGEDGFLEYQDFNSVLSSGPFG